MRCYCLNTLRSRQNGRHFPYDIFKCIFSNENVWIPVKISLKFVPNSPINNTPALVQIMAWRRPGDKPLSEPMMVSLPTHICVTRHQWVKLLHLLNYLKLLPWSPASSAALLILYALLIRYASELAHVRANIWLCALRRKGCRRDCIIAVAGAEGLSSLRHQAIIRLSGPAAVAVLSRWRLSVAICARMFYDTFVFNFGFYLLWWCIYYQWCLYFYQKYFMVMYSCFFTCEGVFHYVLGQRWPNKQVKSLKSLAIYTFNTIGKLSRYEGVDGELSKYRYFRVA